MFCSKCGKEIPDDSLFCLSCGNQISSNTSIDIVDSKNNEIIENNEKSESKFSKRNIDMSHNSLDKMEIKETAYASRVDSVDDKELNEKLFTLYAKLIPPVKELEKNLMLISEAKNDLERKTYIHIKPYAKYLYVVLWGIIVVLMIVKAPLFQFVQNLIPFNFYWSGFSILFLSPLLVILLLQLFLYSLQPLIDKNRFQRDRNVIDKAQNTIERIDVVIAPYIAYVPIDYRHSNALEFFCNAYNNTQIDNLKEAVNRYLEHARHQEILDTINVATATIVSHLQTIEYQNAKTLQKLDSMETSINETIWASSFMFRW